MFYAICKYSKFLNCLYNLSIFYNNQSFTSNPSTLGAFSTQSYDFIANRSPDSCFESSSDESFEEPSKRTRTNVNWRSIIEFNTEEDALIFAKNNSWKFKKDHESKEGDKSFFRCAVNYYCKAIIIVKNYCNQNTLKHFIRVTRAKTRRTSDRQTIQFFGQVQSQARR